MDAEAVVSGTGQQKVVFFETAPLSDEGMRDVTPFPRDPEHCFDKHLAPWAPWAPVLLILNVLNYPNKIVDSNHPGFFKEKCLVLHHLSFSTTSLES